MLSICILGGGFGGLYTAISLANHRQDKYKITLVEQNDHFSFTPLLYELITGELESWQIAPSYAELLQGKKIDFRQDLVEDVDLQNRTVKLKSKDLLFYDYLVLAVGSQAKSMDKVSKEILQFRNYLDANVIIQKIDILKKSQDEPCGVVVVGGGVGGVELVCKLADHLEGYGEVSLIERGDTLLKSYPEKIRNLCQRAMYQRGVLLYLDSFITDLKGNSLKLVYNERKLEIKADLIISAVGSLLPEWVLKLDCSHSQTGKLLTQKTLQLLDYPEVFAIGDIAEIINSTGSIPTTAQAAYQAAFCTSKNLISLVKGERLTEFKYLHLGDMLTLGKGQALVSSFGLNIGGWLGGLIRKWVYLFRLPTFRHRLKVFKSWLKVRSK